MKEDISKSIGELFNALPEAIKVIHNEVNEVGKNVVMSQLKSQDLVTRDEFEAQQALLIALAEKLTKLERALGAQTN